MSRSLAKLLSCMFLALLIASCGCGGNEDAAALVRTLPQNQLEQLFRDVAALDRNRDPSRPAIFSEEKDNIPSSLAFLRPKFVSINGDMTRIHLSGCVDDKVDLMFRGIDGKHPPEVNLSPGERKPLEVVWQSR